MNPCRKRHQISFGAFGTVVPAEKQTLPLAQLGQADLGPKPDSPAVQRNYGNCSAALLGTAIGVGFNNDASAAPIQVMSPRNANP